MLKRGQMLKLNALALVMLIFVGFIQAQVTSDDASPLSLLQCSRLQQVMNDATFENSTLSLLRHQPVCVSTKWNSSSSICKGIAQTYSNQSTTTIAFHADFQQRQIAYQTFVQQPARGNILIFDEASFFALKAFLSTLPSEVHQLLARGSEIQRVLAYSISADEVRVVVNVGTAAKGKTIVFETKLVNSSVQAFQVL